MYKKTKTSLISFVSLRGTKKNGITHMNAAFKTAGICMVLTLLLLLLTGLAAAEDIYVNESNFHKIGSNISGPDADNEIKSWKLDDTYILIEDIDISNVISDMGGTYQPFGTLSFNKETSFSGTFNGNGYTISNLMISSADRHIGLFGYAEDAMFSNIVLEDIQVEGTHMVGGLLGTGVNLTIDNCSIVKSEGGTCTVIGQDLVGGLVGYLSCISITGDEYTNTVSNSSVSADITCSNVGSGAYAGGLIGSSEAAFVTNCSSSGNVFGENCVGGLIGGVDVGDISVCYSASNVSGKDNRIGGFLGAIYGGNISDCYSTGNVHSADDNLGHVGGFIGSFHTSNIKNCYSVGTVFDTVNKNDVGGFAGGLSAGSPDSSITSCFHLNGAGPDNGLSIVKSDGELKQIETFLQTYPSILSGGDNPAGSDSDPWNISSSPEPESIWYIEEDLDYPKFFRKYQQPPESPPEDSGGSGGGTGNANVADPKSSEPSNPKDKGKLDTSGSIKPDEIYPDELFPDEPKKQGSKIWWWLLIILIIIICIIAYRRYKKSDESQF